jgi:hypothetical protein
MGVNGVARVDPYLNGYLGGKTREVSDDLPPTLHSRSKAQNQEIGTCVTKAIGQHAKKFLFHFCMDYPI